MITTRFVIALFLFLFYNQFGSAATRTSTTTGGNWSSSGTWIGGLIPTTSDDVVINGTVTINSNVSCAKVKINSSKQLVFASGGYQLTLTASWTTVFENTGTFTANDGTVVFSPSGSAGQSVTGTTVFNNVILNNVGQMSFGSASNVNGVIRLNSGSQMTNSGHPNYGSNATMEVAGNYNISTNYYLWGSTLSQTPANIHIISGTVSALQALIFVKNVTVSAGATLDLSMCCITLKANTFQSIFNNGTLLLGGVNVESGLVWNIASNITVSNITIQNGAVVNAGNNVINFTYNTTGNCGASGKLIKLVGSGLFNAGTSTLVINASSNGNASFEGNFTFNNIILAGGVLTTNGGNASVKINGNLTVNTGTSFEYGNPINTGALTFGNSSTITNNGGSTSNISTSVPSAPPPVSVDNSLIRLTTSNSGGGTFTNGVTLVAPNEYSLGSNLVVTGSRKVLYIYAPAKFKTNGHKVIADSVYVFGSLLISNAGGIDDFLGSTKVYIDTNATIEYNGNTTQNVKNSRYGNLIFSGSGSKVISAGTITIARDFTVNGVAVDLTANPEFRFDGSKNQLIAGLPYKNVVLSGSGNKTLLDTAKIEGRVSLLGSAQLVSNGLLTLTSRVNGTASIGAVSASASVVGNINYERYLPSGRLWRFIGWPISGCTVGLSWQKDIFITGPGSGGGSLGTLNSNGFDWTTTSEQTVYTYNESLNLGINSKWQGITNTTHLISPTTGYRVFVRGSRSQGVSTLNGSTYIPNAVVLKGSGTINTGNITVNLTSSNGGGSNNGWMFLANPYPSAINWNNSVWVGERNAAIQPTIYVYNPTQNRYGAWNPTGGSVNGGSSEIASGQAFFIKTTANTTLTFKEQFKVDNATVGLFGGNSNNLTNNVKISLGETNKVYDETVVYLHNKATKAFDLEYDAIKPDLGNASISSFTDTDTTKLLFNAISEPSSNSTDTISLYTQLANETYAYVLKFTGIESFFLGGYKLYLYDEFNNHVFLLDSTFVYPFNTIKNNIASNNFKRFKLIIANQQQQLPVTLTTFKGQKSETDVQLFWTTTSEKNNRYFDVMRSDNGSSFYKIAQLAGAGNSNVQIKYFYNDTKPLQGLTYYKLLQVDNNGKTTPSPVIVINTNNVNEKGIMPQVSVYPIPATQMLYLNVNQSIAGFVKICIYNNLGELIKVEQAWVNEDETEVPIELSRLNIGIYAMAITLPSGQMHHVKFIKE